MSEQLLPQLSSDEQSTVDILEVDAEFERIVTASFGETIDTIAGVDATMTPEEREALSNVPGPKPCDFGDLTGLKS